MDFGFGRDASPWGGPVRKEGGGAAGGLAATRDQRNHRSGRLVKEAHRHIAQMVKPAPRRKPRLFQPPKVNLVVIASTITISTRNGISLVIRQNFSE